MFSTRKQYCKSHSLYSYEYEYIQFLQSIRPICYATAYGYELSENSCTYCRALCSAANASRPPRAWMSSMRCSRERPGCPSAPVSLRSGTKFARALASRTANASENATRANIYSIAVNGNVNIHRIQYSTVHIVILL